MSNRLDPSLLVLQRRALRRRRSPSVADTTHRAAAVDSLAQGGRRSQRPCLLDRRCGERVSRLEGITSDPAVCHGQPTIRELRCTVESVLGLLSADMTIDEVLADYPDLEREDILAALEFGARAAGRRRVVPLSAA
jgi:uncharacterized protein (DUF433 family)